jgi:hypothetical protein
MQTKIEIQFKPLRLLIVLFLAAAGLNTAVAQEQRWIRIGESQCFFKDYGSEVELQPNNFLIWPALYGDDQHTTRAKGIWIGATSFNDPVEGKIKTVKVIGSGPRLSDNIYSMVFPKPIKLVGRYYHPTVVVDDQVGTSNILYDELDSLSENLPCDRMIISGLNTSMGVSVTRKILAFTHQDHDNYFIYEYIFKNTGIFNENEDVQEQDLHDFWIYFTYRYAFAGVTTAGTGSNSTWGSFDAEWGSSNLLHNFGPGTPNVHPDYPDMRGFYAWYGPTGGGWGHTLTPEEDWGCPDHEETGVLGSAKYTGVVTLFASKSPETYGTDDPAQPATTAYTGSDGTPTEAAVSQYNESFMQMRYHMMTEGHLDHSQSEAFFTAFGNDGYVTDWNDSNPYRDTNTQGGSSQGQGFGPYTLGFGDSIRIVFAEGVSGLSWESCREVGANWYAYFRDLPTKPELVMPDGSIATDQNEYGYSSFNAYKRAWCDTGADSIMETLNHALSMYSYLYENGEEIPQAPPAPSEFTVQSGGDRIRLTWANNAVGTEGFDGYVIYRSEGSVKDYRTVYKKVKQFDGPDAPHEWDDTTPVRGFDYYYAIQSKTDGSNNNGVPLYSSLFLTLTSVPAQLQRPAIPVTPVAPDADSTSWKSMSSKGAWISGFIYNKYDAVSYTGLIYVCVDAVSGDSAMITPNLNVVQWKLTTSKGEWISGSGYRAYDVVSYNGLTYVCLVTIPSGKGLDLVRVVPNPYDMRARAVQYGEDFQYDRISFFGLPPICTLKIFTERGDLIWEKYHDTSTGDEIWNSQTTYGQIIVSGIYILYVETPDGRSVIRKFVVIR